MKLRTILALAACALVLPACGGSEALGDDPEALTIYSGRQERLVGPLLERFEQESGVDVEVRYGDSAELAATLAEEGDRTPADAVFLQDAGALGAVEEEGLLAPLPQGVLDRVEAKYRSPSGRWVGITGRARVIAYSTERVERKDLPTTIFDFTDPEWRGRIGFPPPNASFQAFVSAMRLSVGEDRTRAWLEGIKANEPTLLENNIQTEEAIASGEIDVGFVNNYYLGELKAERPDFPVANHFLRDGDPGSLVNVAGIGIVKGAENADAARRLAGFLLAEEAQRDFRDRLFEYPLIEGGGTPEGSRPLEQLQGPDVDLRRLGGMLESTLQLLNDVGFTV
jgi:iron(III) transport system substrate-binding protein